MAITNAPGVTFCWVGDDPIFLDLRRDRYLALTPPAADALRRLTGRAAAVEGDAAHLDQLIERGLLITRPGSETASACSALPAATISLRDESRAAVTGPCWPAMADLIKARAALRIMGLQRTLGQVARLKRARVVSNDRDNDGERLAHLATAFREADTRLGALDLCVPRSVAMALRSARLGCRCDLVVGVKLRPFAAHCWVQRDHMLLNESVDVVRQFTPILIV